MQVGLLPEPLAFHAVAPLVVQVPDMHRAEHIPAQVHKESQRHLVLLVRTQHAHKAIHRTKHTTALCGIVCSHSHQCRIA